jgi:alkylhydroperoxidase family enzyme
MLIMRNAVSKPRRHAGKIQSLVDSVLNSRGDSDPELRRAVEHQAATCAGRLQGSGVRLPQELGNYVDKIARHAFKVTDGDIEVLRDTGYSEDAIFELTISAALGAGIARLDRAIAAMKGEIDAPEKH